MRRRHRLISKMKNNLIKKELKEMLIGKEITAGFTNNRKSVVVYTDNYSLLFCSGQNGLEMGIPKRMGIKITPERVRCDSIGLIQDRYLILKLGSNRGLALSYLGKNNLSVIYSPDEADLEYNRSEFMQKCEGRGLL